VFYWLHVLRVEAAQELLPRALKGDPSALCGHTTHAELFTNCVQELSQAATFARAGRGSTIPGPQEWLLTAARHQKVPLAATAVFMEKHLDLTKCSIAGLAHLLRRHRR
jgi:hypothetical protein